MDGRLNLRFLRPYLVLSPSPKTAAYARFFSVSCHKPRQARHIPRFCLQNSSCSRSIHGSAAQDVTYTNHDISPSQNDASSLSRRPITDSNRIQKLKNYHALQYPRLKSSPIRISVPTFRKRYQDVAGTPIPEDPEEVVLEGRVMSVRRSGPKLVFLTIMGGYQQVQIMISLSQLSDPKPEPREFREALHPFIRGDVVSVKGTAMRTTAGELTLKAAELPTLISPSLTPLPEELINRETMLLKRHVDLLVNRPALDTFRLRSHIIKYMRDFFHEKDFLEVQTPVLADYASGATARPFLTSATEFPHKELALRIAPELWLKRLVIGGNDKVFEIGTCFRNEGIDTSHNPEFTMCEFYAAYSNLSDLILLTENLITRLFKHVEHLQQSQLESLEKPKINLPGTNWNQIEFIPALEKILDIRFPDLSEPDALPKILELLNDRASFAHGRELTLPKFLDELASKYLEVSSHEQPLFIIHHPACMSPLSKSFTCPKTGQLVSARAELFIDGREIANMYEEENDPYEQRRKFELQLESQQDNPTSEKEGPGEVDESYVQALMHGLPPTGGWGCGVDRLVMLFSGAPRIGQVLGFGTLRNVVSIHQQAKDA
ncbi:lysyl-tRNA synthetase [Hypoxylon fragiforme]|uniref:lysyl-tRNA synthetase n=1 Tax=Hypoxylon fragiforme TaxID=63214 RepID=UPI0020C68AB4|nr:lysyl-tRNA synthetase [Hypoxylon fragiforme]KAI2603855.1 lysyl-tRNA synthetase [Hypoxylon fragiforme]